MNEPIHMGELARAIDSGWDETRERSVFESFQLRRKVRTRNRRIAAAALLAGAAGLLLIHGGLVPSATRKHSPPAAEANGVVRLADGSVVTKLRPDSEVVVTSTAAERIIVELRNGGARFDVVPSRTRRFEVKSGQLSVVVVGTRFDVWRVDSEHTSVQVSRGRVEVHWPQAITALGPGDLGLFPPPKEAPTMAYLDLSSPKDVSEGQSNNSASDWRALARRGDYALAHAALEKAPEQVQNSVNDLMLAADAARLSGHPTVALGYLERVLSAHAGDPQAPIAAFTLGRVHLQLGRADAAARAFARCRNLAPRGALAQDALAREVQAWEQAGDDGTATSRAQEYLSRYPDGRYSKEMQARLGGAK
ncbi:MAG TPA: FecR domain-containing protein [Polyangiaceae bacterium]